MALTFDASYYLTQNADVLSAVSRGLFANAQQHYTAFGARELRNPNSVFNARDYALQNPDVLAAVNTGQIQNVFSHYLAFGAAENRAPNAGLVGFSAAKYLEQNPDVAAAVGSGKAFASAMQHYLLYGQNEARIAPGSDGKALAGGVGGTVSLTLGTDSVSGSTINAPALFNAATGTEIMSLNTADVLRGVGTGAALNATFTSSQSVQPTSTGVQVLNLTPAATVAGNLNAASMTGVTQAWLVDSAGTADLTVDNLAAGVTVGMRNTGALPVSGATPAQGSDYTVKFANSAVSGTADSVSIVLDNVGKGAVTSNTGPNPTFGILNISGTSAGGFETANITLTGANSRLLDLGSDPTGNLTVAGNASTLTKLVLTGDKGLRVNNTIENLTTVDSTAVTAGTIRLVLDATKDVTVLGGKGSEDMTFGSGLTNADKFDGGEGRDTIRVSNASGVISGNQVTNVERLIVTGSDTVEINLANISSIDQVGSLSSGSVTFSKLSATGAADARGGVQLFGTGAVTVGVLGADAVGAANDTLTVSVFNPGTQTAPTKVGALTANNIEILKINVDNDALDGAAAGINGITGSTAREIVLTGGESGETFTVGGTLPFVTGGTTFNAGAFVGKLVVTGDANGHAVVLGTSDDTYTTGGRTAAQAADTIDLTKGGNDTIVFATGDRAGTDLYGLVAGTIPSSSTLRNIPSITGLDLAGASSSADLLNLATAYANQSTVTATDVFNIVNGGAVSTLPTGTDLLTRINAATNGGALTGSADGRYIGLFSDGTDTYLIVNDDGRTNAVLGANDLVVKVTGVTGTLDGRDLPGIFTRTTDNKIVDQSGTVQTVGSAPTGTTTTTPTTPATGTFTLTTGTDSFVGTSASETFTAALGTVGTSDVLVGGGGIDTLNVTVVGTISTPTAISDIDVINVAAPAAGTLNLSTASQLGTLNVSGAGNVTLTLAGNTPISSASTVLKEVALSSGYAGTVTANTGTGAATFTLNGTATGAAISTDSTGGTTIAVPVASSLSGGVTTGATALTINGAGNLTLGAVTTATSVAAGAMTGALTYTTSGTINLTSGSGNDSITSGTGATATITTGAGNDTINAPSGTAVPTLDGGTGTDVLNLTGNTAVAAAHLDAVTNVETINVANTTTNVAVTSVNALVGFGQTLTFNASSLTTGTLTFNGSAETDGIFVITAGGANDTISGGAGPDTLAGGAGADSISSGAGADSVNVGSGNGDIVAFGQNTVATTDIVTGFTLGATAAGGDIAHISVTQNGAVAAVNRIANGNEGAVGAGAAVVQVVAGAATIAATTNVIALSGTFADSAAVITAISAGGTRALTWNANPTANSDLVVVWTNGTDAFINIYNDSDAGDNTAVAAGEVTLAASVARLVGITDVSTAVDANFTFIA